MKLVKKSWQYLLTEPFRWIFYCFFQPIKFERKYAYIYPFRLSQSVTKALRLILPMLSVFYPLVLVINAILMLFHNIPTLSFVHFLINPLPGIVLGIVLSIALSITPSLTISITISAALAITLGIAAGTGTSTLFAERVFLGISFILAEGAILGITYILVVRIKNVTEIIALIVIVVIALVLVAGVALVLVAGVALVLVAGSVAGIVLGVIGGASLGLAGNTEIHVGGDTPFVIALGILVSIIIGISSGITGEIVLSISLIGGYFRFPLYFCSCCSGLRNYFASRNDPQRVFRYLHRSSLYWDERVYIPIPFLKSILLTAVNEDAEQALEEIAFIITKRPQQIRAARTAALEIASHELEMCHDLFEIGAMSERLTEIFPPETKLIAPQWITVLAHLRDASQEATRSCSPIGQQAKQIALEKMKVHLRRIHPNVAFRDQRLNSRLAKVIENWRAIVQQEQEKLAHAPQVIGKLDNPYRPGNVLKIGDPLFVGRRGLVLQLEEALSRGDGHPTFLLFGERRMGKSTSLMQLPNLLGSRYLPIFCDLQEPGVSSNIAIFLSTLATRIQQAMAARDLRVGQLKADLLENARRENEARVYHVFNHWLAEVEEILVRHDRMLLLTFDEIEMLDEIKRTALLNLNFLLDWFRNLIQYHPQLALLFSAVRTLDELGTTTGINWAGYFVNVRMLHVGFLEPGEANQLITTPTPDFPGSDIFSREVAQCIITRTGCHPFLVQAVCSMLIDNLNTTRREQAGIEDVDQAIKQVLNEWWNTYFLDLWRRTDEEQRVCLSALKTLEPADLPAIAQHSGLDERTVRQAMRLLVQRDLVALATTNETYSIAAPIFRDWVERGLDL